MNRSLLLGFRRVLGLSNFTGITDTCTARMTVLSNCQIHTSGRRLEADEEKVESDIDSSIDRSTVIPVETSIKYMESEAYKTTYGDEAVWVKYRRNFKGQYPPHKTRKTCIRKDQISTGSPCPICRDEYLVLDYRNVELLNQFISPYTGEILSYRKTNICQKRHKQLLLAVDKAQDYGLITFDVPFREYDYSDYYNSNENEK